MLSWLLKLIPTCLIVLIIVLMEFFLTSYPRDHLSKILTILHEREQLWWFQKPNQKGVFFGGEFSTDNNGFRETSGSYDRNPAIIVLGASPSFGWGVDNEQTYSYLLQSFLNQNGYPKTTVLNASGIGLSSHQGNILSKRILKKYRPKIVYISYLINDGDTYRFYRSKKVHDYQLSDTPTWQMTLRNILAESSILRVIKQLLRQRPIQKKFDNKIVRVPVLKYRKNLMQIIKRVRSVGATPVLVKMALLNNPEISKDVSPFLSQQLSTFRSRFKTYQATIENVAKESEVGMIDVSSVIHSFQEPYKLYPEGDLIHPNAKGHKLIGDAIIKYTNSKLLKLL